MRITRIGLFVFISALLIILTSQSIYAQNIIKKDTIYVNDDSFEDKATYGARDSIYLDVENNKIYLFGEAFLNFMDTKMNAGFIEVDLDKMKYLHPMYSIRIAIGLKALYLKVKEKK